MKKALLFSILMCVSAISVFAYETVIIKYPAGELWEKAYYKKVGNEAILQYVPKGQTHENWKRSIIIHSYYENSYPLNIFMTNDLMRMKRTNPTGTYKYLRTSPVDSMATRCTNDYKQKNGNVILAQCEFYRATHAHNGTISLHYINRNIEDFKANYNLWYKIIKEAKYYNSYYRDERTFDKSEYFELW
ncbi:MAG: hypothetical protein MJ237_01935 [bacterium]|nr:hypothetical protein [bacterium]